MMYKIKTGYILTYFRMKVYQNINLRAYQRKLPGSQHTIGKINTQQIE